MRFGAAVFVIERLYAAMVLSPRVASVAAQNGVAFTCVHNALVTDGIQRQNDSSNSRVIWRLGVAHAHTVEDHCAAERQQAAKRAFEAAGEQWTAMRASVFQVLLETAGPMGAYDVADKVSRNLDKRIAPNTIYRILDLFVAHNLVSRIESKNAFIASAHPEHADDCIFLVCGACGKTTHIDDPNIAQQVRATAAATGFHPLRPVIEVQGRCNTCKENAFSDRPT